METTLKKNKSKQNRDILIMLVTAVAICLYLGYIDEGYYNFNFLTDPGSIIALAIYATAIFLCSYLCYGVLFKNVQFKGKVFVSIVSGITLGITLAVCLFFGIKYL